MNLKLSRNTSTSTLLAISLAVFTSSALASGTHGGGHAKPAVDYSDVEKHEFGMASDPSKAKQTITVDMSDTMRFEPSQIEVKKGETVRFVIRNKGKLQHEMVLGTGTSLDAHAKLMMKFPGMEHDEPHMAHVDAGAEHEMGWQFTEAGEFNFACLVPGHSEAGMKGMIIVR